MDPNSGDRGRDDRIAGLALKHRLPASYCLPAFVERRAARPKLPTFAEPWSLTFNADVEFHVAMTPEDLARAGLDALGKQWA